MNFLIALCIFILILSLSQTTWKYDSTDNKETKTRSGLILYIDQGTGLHYIKGGIFGAMIPRMDEHGHQIRNKDDDRRN